MSKSCCFRDGQKKRRGNSFAHYIKIIIIITNALILILSTLNVALALAFIFFYMKNKVEFYFAGVNTVGQRKG